MKENWLDTFTKYKNKKKGVTRWGNEVDILGENEERPGIPASYLIETRQEDPITGEVTVFQSTPIKNAVKTNE